MQVDTETQASTVKVEEAPAPVSETPAPAPITGNDGADAMNVDPSMSNHGTKRKATAEPEVDAHKKARIGVF